MNTLTKKMQAKLQEVSELDKELVNMILLRSQMEKQSDSDKFSESEAREMMLQAIKCRNQSTAFLLCLAQLLQRENAELKQAISALMQVDKL